MLFKSHFIEFSFTPFSSHVVPISAQFSQCFLPSRDVSFLLTLFPLLIPILALSSLLLFLVLTLFSLLISPPNPNLTTIHLPGPAALFQLLFPEQGANTCILISQSGSSRLFSSHESPVPYQLLQSFLYFKPLESSPAVLLNSFKGTFLNRGPSVITVSYFSFRKVLKSPACLFFPLVFSLYNEVFSYLLSAVFGSGSLPQLLGGDSFFFGCRFPLNLNWIILT